MKYDNKVELRVSELLHKYSETWDGNLDEWDPDSLDSLSYIELAFDIEDVFDIELPMDPNALKNPRDLIRLVENKLDEQE